MLHSFSDIDVSIAGNSFKATSAEISSSQDIQKVSVPGYKGVLGTSFSGKPKASGSFSFLGGAPSRPVDFSDIENSKVSVSVGPVSGEGILTSVSVSVQPNQPVSGSATYEFLNGISGDLGDSYSSSSNSNLGRDDIFDGGHGSASEGAKFEASYSFNMSLGEILLLGEYEPEYIYVSDAEESITISGDDIGGKIDGPVELCSEGVEQTLSFTIKSLCGVFSQEYSVTGVVVQSKISVGENGEVSGSITVKKHLV